MPILQLRHIFWCFCISVIFFFFSLWMLFIFLGENSFLILFHLFLHHIFFFFIFLMTFLRVRRGRGAGTYVICTSISLECSVKPALSENVWACLYTLVGLPQRNKSKISLDTSENKKEYIKHNIQIIYNNFNM